MKLEFEVFDLLYEALGEIYPEESVSLKRMVGRVFNKRLDSILGSGRNQETLLYKLVEKAEGDDKIIDLLRAAYQEKPASTELRTIFSDHFSDILRQQITCIDNKSGLNLTTIQRLVELPLLTASISDIVSAGSVSLPAGAWDEPSENLRDFDNESVVMELRFWGLLSLVLAEYPKKGEHPSVLLFAFELCNLVGAESTLGEALSQWVATAEAECGCAVPKAPDGKKALPVGELQASLMITVGPCAKRIDGRKALQVRGALFFDQVSDSSLETYPPEELFISDDDGDSAVVYCLWQNIDKYINQFVRAATNRLKPEHPKAQELNYETYYLTIEVFLPLGRMGENIDQIARWQTPKRSVPLGTEFGVIVRSFDRFNPMGEYQEYVGSNEIRRAWKALPACWQTASVPDYFEMLEALTADCFDPLEARLKQKVGLKVCCGLPVAEAERQKLFETILYGAAPIATWTRSTDIVETQAGEVVVLDISKALDRFLTEDCSASPSTLAEALRSLRQNARGEMNSEKKGRCLGDHVAFMLDNPERLPPSLL